MADYTKELHPPTNDYLCWPDYLPLQPGGGPNPSDMDSDGINNVSGCDNCSGGGGLQWSNPWQEDYDGDGIGNSCDPCPLSTQSPCPASPEPPVPQPSIVDVWSSTIPVVTLAELHIYGSDRLGMYLPNEARDTAQLVNVVSFVRTLRKREYELKDHVGNVRVTISDLKIGNGTPIYNADIRSYTNHYAFGMVQPDRSWVVGGGYRYGFNGKESDNEISGNGNQYDYGFRIYNPRIARFLSEDPLTKEYPMLTPYQFAGNMPIWAIDLDGLEAQTTTEQPATGADVLSQSSTSAASGVVQQSTNQSQKNSADRTAAKALEKAREYVEKKEDSHYRLGAKGNPGTDVDCSGLVSKCVVHAGFPDPVGRNTGTGVQQHEQAAYHQIPLSAIKPGDLVTFRTGGGWAYHIGIIESVIQQNGNVAGFVMIHSSGSNDGPAHNTIMVTSENNTRYEEFLSNHIYGFWRWTMPIIDYGTSGPNPIPSDLITNP